MLLNDCPHVGKNWGLFMSSVVTEIAYCCKQDMHAQFFPKICFSRHAYIKREILPWCCFSKCCSWKRPLLLTKLIFARLLRLFPVTSSFQLVWHIFCFLFIFLKVIVISHVKYSAVTSSFTIHSLLLVTWSLKNSSRRNDETFRCRNIWCG